MSRKVFTLGFCLVLFTVLLLSATTVLAAPILPGVNLTSATFGCSTVSVTYEITLPGVPPINARIVKAGTGTVISSSVSVPTAVGTHTVSFTLSPAQAAGTLLQAEVESSPLPWTALGPAVACAADAEPAAPAAPDIPRYRYYGGGGALFAAFVEYSDSPDNPTLVLYKIDDKTSAGSLLFYVSLKQLQLDFAAPPAQNTLVEISGDGLFAFYVLTTGEFQINAGPDKDGYIHVMIFRGIPPTGIYTYKFNIYGTS